MPAATKVKPSRNKRVVVEAPMDTQFGLEWPFREGEKPEFCKRLWCARHKRGNVPQWEHRKWIIQNIWPEYVWTEWTETRLKGWCDHNFTTWLGPAASGKTSDAAIFCLEYWLEAPFETSIGVCSTTKDLLRTRIWGDIVKWFLKIPEAHHRYIFTFEDQSGVGGELLDASCFIRYKDGDWKHGIKGFAVEDGPAEEAVNNLIGVHAIRVVRVLDEMQGVNKAIMKAIPNLLKNPETKFHGMGNPWDINSLLCTASEPVGGWKSIKKFQDSWETDSQGYLGTGRCFFFDGRKSPAVLDDEWAAKNVWMINRAQLESHLKKCGGNEGHPEFMAQTIGWPPDKGLEETVLDGSIITQFNCKDAPQWTDGFVEFAAIDPAYEGGDDPIMQIMRRGLVKEEIPNENPLMIGQNFQERWVVAGVEQIVIPRDSEAALSIDYQIVNYVKAYCTNRGIKPAEVAVATSGRGASLKAIFDQEWGTVNGVEEGGSPSDRVALIGPRGQKTAKEHYNTRASELCMGLKDFALGNGIRNLPQEVIEQACARYTFTLNGKLCVEPKKTTKGLQQAKGAGAKGFKERLGYSPDELDAWNIGLEHARQKGAVPSFGLTSPKKVEEWNKEVKHDSEVETYEETDWAEEAKYVMGF